MCVVGILESEKKEKARDISKTNDDEEAKKKIKRDDNVSSG